MLKLVSLLHIQFGTFKIAVETLHTHPGARKTSRYERLLGAVFIK